VDFCWYVGCHRAGSSYEVHAAAQGMSLQLNKNVFFDADFTATEDMLSP
jgi:hypothetical protein